MSRTAERSVLSTLFWLFACGTMIGAALYAYLLQQTFSHLVVYKEAAGETEEMNRQVGELEARYNTLVAGITKDRATELGLVPAEQVSFASHDSIKALSLQSGI